MCWPCLEYEREQRQKGVPQQQIRPARWQMAACGMTHEQLEGGSTAVSCCLCPVKHGAFKKTTDTKEWVHVVSLWDTGSELIVHALPACMFMMGDDGLAMYL